MPMNLIKPLVPQPVANLAGIKALSLSPLYALKYHHVIHNVIQFLAGPLLAIPKQLNISILTIPC